MQRTHQDISPMETARARLDARSWLDRRLAWERRLATLERSHATAPAAPGQERQSA